MLNGRTAVRVESAILDNPTASDYGIARSFNQAGWHDVTTADVGGIRAEIEGWMRQNPHADVTRYYRASRYPGSE